MNREEVAWAAGLFDGEGSFTYSGGHGHGRYPVVRITQTDAAVLHRFRGALMNIGRVSGPYHTAHRPTFHYYAYGIEKTQAIGAMLWAFLSPPKRAQFNTRMTACDWEGLLHRTAEHREKISAGILRFHAKRKTTPFTQTVDQAVEQAARLLNTKEI